ncbi:MAG: nicotinamide-nucleotide amidohydrolase family protein [Clostridia bacterium]
MKAKIFCISDNVLLGKKQASMVAALAKELFLAGIFIESSMLLPCNELLIEKTIAPVLVENSSIFIVSSGEGQGKEFLTNILSKLSNDTISENSFAKEAVLSYFNKNNLVATKDSEKEFVFPTKARAIVNSFGLSQGYITKVGNSNIFVLPFPKQELVFVMKEAVIPYIFETMGQKTKTLVLKTFGISAVDLSFVLREEIRNKDKVSISLFENGPLVDIAIKAKMENAFIDSLAQTIFEKIGKYVYAEEDISLAEACFKLLKQSHQTVAIAESISGGEIVSSLIKNNVGATSVVLEGIVSYTNESKIDLLGVSPDTLKEHNAVSSEVVYEMATGMLARANSDFVIATTGYANHENNDLCGLCYIAVGNKQEIHIYKNKFVGTREENIEATTACALFFLIKKLRKNDFHFEKTVV